MTWMRFGRICRILLNDLSIAAMLCLGFFATHHYANRPKSHGLQAKIDELKERIRESDRNARARASFALTIPHDTGGSMMECLFTTPASPIRWVHIGPRRIADDQCSMNMLDNSMSVKVWCPITARKIAESCAASVR